MNILLFWVGLMFTVLIHANQLTWSNYQVIYKKAYKNQTELELRQKIFNANLKIIEEHNKKYDQGLVSYKLGVNKFTDLTDEEFKANLKTFQVSKDVLQSGRSNYEVMNNSSETPASIDWRNWKNRSFVTEVKDQGSCGSCWAFSATGTIEAQLALLTGELKSLSEQQLVDCDDSNFNCQGGRVQYAYQYIAKNGLTLEKNYPYVANKQNCNNRKKKEKVVWTTGYVNINQNDETDLKNAVGRMGPVSVAINANNLQSYSGGIYDETCPPDINHAVLAVGYVTNTTPPYWIMKNSWGKNWGEQGYFRMVMGKGLCGVATQACYPFVSTSSGYSINRKCLSLFILVTLAILKISGMR